jgi:radical SAM superfamily enzyme YgiQ (UPF0313 family)
VGPPASQYPDWLLQNGADSVARYEYEFTVGDLVNSFEDSSDLSNVSGLSFRMDGNIIHNPNRELAKTELLDQLPFVSEVYQKHLNIRNYFLNHSFYPMVQILTSRGCPNLCTFCSWPETLMGRHVRTRSEQNVVDEFEFIARNLPEVKEVFIEDDSFTLSKRRVVAICEELRKRNLGIPWSCQSRATLDYETMKTMKIAGCRLLDVGYESGSDEVLKEIRKELSTDQLEKFTLNARRAHLKVLADFVIGFPGESKETAQMTQAFIKRIRPDLLQVAVATPIPGTQFYNYCKSSGYMLTDDLSSSIDQNGFQKCIISYPGLTAAEIESTAAKIVREYYLNVSYIPIVLRGVLGKNGPEELKSILKSARAFIGNLSRIGN